jgi:hypothetical protein
LVGPLERVRQGSSGKLLVAFVTLETPLILCLLLRARWPLLADM